MRDISSAVGQFTANKRGSITTMSAILTPFLLAAMAMATDVGTWHTNKTELRFQADASALTAAYLHNRGLTPSQIKPIVEAELVAQGLPSASLQLNIQYPTSTSDLLTLSASYESEKYLSQLVYPGTVTVSASTVVKTQNYEACVLALNNSAAGAFTATGSTSVDLTGCVVASNSSASDAVSLGGSASITADCLVSSGGITGENKATTACGSNSPYAPKSLNPFAQMVQPAHMSSSCKNAGNFKPNQSSSLSQGCFKGSVDLKGNVTLSPGVYVLDGANLKINSNATITGTDVTFVLKNGATLDFNGGATINLTAPQKGSTQPFPGMLFWSDGSSAVSHKLSGNSTSKLQGAIYLPGDEVTFTGNSGMDTGCMRLAADTIKFTGNSDLKSECANELNDREIVSAGAVVIVQ